MNVTGQFPGLRRLEGDRWGRVWYTEEGDVNMYINIEAQKYFLNV